MRSAHLRLPAILAVVFCFGEQALAQVKLGTAAPFGILGSTAITNTGATVITGKLAISPNTASSITGFPPGIASGQNAGDGVALQARNDANTAYLAAAGQTSTSTITGGQLGGQTLVAGTYTAAAAVGLTGTLTLDGGNNPDSLFVFQIGSTLTTATSAQVVLINGAQACNVFWQVGVSATLGTTTTFVGNILAYTSISLNNGVTVAGGLYALNGAVTLNNDQVTIQTCAITTTTSAVVPPVTSSTTVPAGGDDTTTTVPGDDNPAPTDDTPIPGGDTPGGNNPGGNNPGGNNPGGNNPGGGTLTRTNTQPTMTFPGPGQTTSTPSPQTAYATIPMSSKPLTTLSSVGYYVQSQSSVNVTLPVASWTTPGYVVASQPLITPSTQNSVTTINASATASITVVGGVPCTASKYYEPACDCVKTAAVPVRLASLGEILTATKTSSSAVCKQTAQYLEVCKLPCPVLRPNPTTGTLRYDC
ncbi:uncharacterized protein K460DRAFT_388280 [Cucurbitaria berberidis CBS 394.84]|uniref:DUF3494 domain-containing protein n=1 Tax=Cucurbitaria berberidis CBS 394.84 TaxID=1168544 RepID=A0A9P4GEE8_9PLEO|nr:uncharacterized protein K460DRAFT_388280 [Cucurbitaria berberidis CBS 394.84]KAF1844473.1 hypothetical protein K460DRAFT_388280 [Cucurbitaria berberidis CBS 394.84]